VQVKSLLCTVLVVVVQQAVDHGVAEAAQPQYRQNEQECRPHRFKDMHCGKRAERAACSANAHVSRLRRSKYLI
jgi:hypothetical protein